jgi:excisionase family DNA binding protein
MHDDSAKIIPFAVKLQEAADSLGYCKRTIERLVRRGKLETIGSGKMRRVLYASILAYIERERKKAA